MDLKGFIIQSRKNTYAGDAGLVSPPLIENSKQLEYKEGDHLYRDVYFPGKKNFIGMEVVYRKNKPIWAMNYFGHTEDPKVFNFLKEALFKRAEICRFGGGTKFDRDPYSYIDIGQGSLSRFSGEERIFIDGDPVYTLRYQGGKIA